MLRYDVVVDDIVVWLLKNLPGLRNGLHQAPLRNPKQLAVDWVIGVHAEKPGVVFNLLVLGTAVGTLRNWVLLKSNLWVITV